MIYVTGDCHGVRQRLTDLPQEICRKGNILLITGDFGYIQLGEEQSREEKEFLDTLAELPCSIAFLDGNHEGFDALEKYPLVQRFGSPVSLIRNNIFWLRRGRIYEMEGLRMFVMGGAYSMDKPFRLAVEREGGTKWWFSQELPGQQEYNCGIRALKAAGNQVDCILTHTAPRSMISRLTGGFPDLHDGELTGFLDWIYSTVQFRKWYFGHFHQDLALTEKLQCCYKEFYCINDQLKRQSLAEGTQKSALNTDYGFENWSIPEKNGSGHTV